jgi:hypothetical protein
MFCVGSLKHFSLSCTNWLCTCSFIMDNSQPVSNRARIFRFAILITTLGHSWRRFSAINKDSAISVCIFPQCVKILYSPIAFYVYRIKCFWGNVFDGLYILQVIQVRLDNPVPVAVLHTCKVVLVNTIKWWKKLFFHLFDLAMVNSHT